MRDELSIERIVEKAEETRRLAASAAAQEAIRSARVAEQMQERANARESLAGQVRLAGAAVAQRLHEANVPYSIDSVRRYKPGFQLWAITSEVSTTTRYRESRNPKYYAGGQNREGESAILQTPFLVTIDAGFALSGEGTICKYVKETGMLSNPLVATEATSRDIVSPEQLDEAAIDAVVLLWQDRYANMLPPKDIE